MCSYWFLWVRRHIMNQRNVLEGVLSYDIIWQETGLLHHEEPHSPCKCSVCPPPLRQMATKHQRQEHQTEEQLLLWTCETELWWTPVNPPLHTHLTAGLLLCVIHSMCYIPYLSSLCISVTVSKYLHVTVEEAGVAVCWQVCLLNIHPACQAHYVFVAFLFR